ncbi:glycosyltransferase 87 family protein [Streptomyces acidiscabies]|uniref:glycosyltransferase 87 family protein n=1 Tax=Streptomyces acidiscabies TaxID=42234 RepID=UPI0038F7A16A
MTLPSSRPPGGVKKRHRLHRLLLLAAGWLGTRALMLWLLTHADSRWLGEGNVTREVWRLYHDWYLVLAHGTFPTHDALWQYPPGAGAVMLSPALLPFLSYFQAFVVLTLVCDAVTTAALARAGSAPGRSPAGAALWVCGLPLLLHTPLARYDVQVTMLGVLSLVTMARRPRVAGAFAALGALVKVWPALLLLGAPKGRATRAAWAGATVTAVTVLAVLAAAFDHPFSFLREQGGRGVQIESLGGTVLLFATHAGWPGAVRYQYGAIEFVGPYVADVADASLALTAVAFALLLLWRLRSRRHTPATPFDAALCAVLLFTVTSRVISPQYMIWLVGLSAVCLTSRHTVQRPVTALVLAATAVSAVVYPGLYGQVTACTWLGCALMLLRNGLLLTAAVLSFVRLWRTTTGRAGGGTGSYPQARRREPAPA